jgi:hypothetical protein
VKALHKNDLFQEKVTVIPLERKLNTDKSCIIVGEAISKKNKLVNSNNFIVLQLKTLNLF